MNNFGRTHEHNNNNNNNNNNKSNVCRRGGKQGLFVVAVFALALVEVRGYSPATLAAPTRQQPVTSSSVNSGDDDVQSQLPKFDELFHSIQEVSPLARLAMQGDAQIDGKRGFEAMDKDMLKWKMVEKNTKGIVHQIDRIDNFGQKKCPILRFRSSLEGPCDGEAFARLTLRHEERSQWDASIDEAYERIAIEDPATTTSTATGLGSFGDCRRMSVAYCKTKSYLGVSGREQLIVGGIQDFPDGSTVIWGTEMQDRFNHLLPEGARTTRAKSHLFSTTLVPTGPNQFDVEYCVQLEVGGNIPTWITTPIIVDTIKSQLRYAKGYFGGMEVAAAKPSLLEKQSSLPELAPLTDTMLTETVERKKTVLRTLLRRPNFLRRMFSTTK